MHAIFLSVYIGFASCLNKMYCFIITPWLLWRLLPPRDQNYDDLTVRNRRSLTSSVSSTESLPESMQSSNPRDTYRIPRATTGTQIMLPGMYCTTLRRDTSAEYGGRVGGGQQERILPDRPIIISS